MMNEMSMVTAVKWEDRVLEYKRKERKTDKSFRPRKYMINRLFCHDHPLREGGRGS